MERLRSAPAHQPSIIVLEFSPVDFRFAPTVDSLKDAALRAVLQIQINCSHQEVLFPVTGLHRRPFAVLKLVRIDAVHGSSTIVARKWDSAGISDQMYYGIQLNS